MMMIKTWEGRKKLSSKVQTPYQWRTLLTSPDRDYDDDDNGKDNDNGDDKNSNNNTVNVKPPYQ